MWVSYNVYIRRGLSKRIMYNSPASLEFASSHSSALVLSYIHTFVRSLMYTDVLAAHLNSMKGFNLLFEQLLNHSMLLNHGQAVEGFARDL